MSSAIADIACDDLADDLVVQTMREAVARGLICIQGNYEAWVTTGLLAASTATMHVSAGQTRILEV